MDKHGLGQQNIEGLSVSLEQAEQWNMEIIQNN